MLSVQCRLDVRIFFIQENHTIGRRNNTPDAHFTQLWFESLKHLKRRCSPSNREFVMSLFTSENGLRHQKKGWSQSNITGRKDRREIVGDRYSSTRDKLRDRKRQIFLDTMDIILEIERYRVLGMQIGYLEEIEKVPSLSILLLLSHSIFLLPVG